MKKSRFDIEYNRWLQQVDVGEEDSVWNEIQDELDFIETWKNISARLEEIKPRKDRLISMNHLKKVAVAAAVLLLLFLSVNHFFRRENPSPIISGKMIETDEKEKRGPDNIPTLAAKREDVGKSSLTEVKQTTENGVASSGENDTSRVKTSPSLREPTKVNEVRSTENMALLDGITPLKKIQGPLLSANHLLPRTDVLGRSNLMETENSFMTKQDKSLNLPASKSFFKIVDIGLVYGYKNTWLLNYETRNSLDPTQLGNVQPTFKQDMGIASTIELNNRHKIGLELFLKSESGQNYRQYFNASFVEKNINLDYLKFQTFYCWENKRFPGQFIVGGYVAKLTMAEEHIAGTRAMVSDHYNDLDYGLLAGYQLNIPITKNMIIKPGVRFNYNLVNIFAGDNVIPGNFKDTRNLATSFNLAFSYKF